MKEPLHVCPDCGMTAHVDRPCAVCAVLEQRRQKEAA